MYKQFVYIFSFIGILAIANCPLLCAEEPSPPVVIDFDELAIDTFYIDDSFSTSIAEITIESQVEFSGDDDQSQYPGYFVNISDASLLGATGMELGDIRNVNLDFDFSSTVDSLVFSFYEDGGNLNLSVNGEMLNFYDFDDINNSTIGGVAVSVAPNGPNLGEVTLTGTIYSFKLGGTELRIDNLTVTPAGAITFHVDVNGNDSNLGLTEADAFATIQTAIDFAHDGDVILVQPGIYTESLIFTGEAITLMAFSEPPIIQSPDEIAMTFYLAEGQDTIIQNVIIANSRIAIFCEPGSPTIRNITVAGNDFGLVAYNNSAPDVYNCIFWDNKTGDVSGCDVSYCSSQQLLDGIGNISGDPRFVTSSYFDDDVLVHGDYHLKSQGWRWNSLYRPEVEIPWTHDEISSRCIDAGNPSCGLNEELMVIIPEFPNLWAINIRVNMGAYGGTAQASMGPYGHTFLSDIDNDGYVNGNDILILGGQWLESGLYLPADLNRNGYVDLSDYSLLSSQFGQLTQWGMGIDIKEYWPFENNAKWQSEIIDGESFTLEITEIADVNGITASKFSNSYTIDAQTVYDVEYRFFADDVMYSVQDPNDLITHPEFSGNYTSLFKQLMVSGEPFSFEGSVLTPIRGLLSSVLVNSAMTVQDFPGGASYDVLALYKDYGLPGESIVAIFGRGEGPLYIKSKNTAIPFIMELISAGF